MRITKRTSCSYWCGTGLLALGVLAMPATSMAGDLPDLQNLLPKKLRPKQETPAQLRADYLVRVGGMGIAPEGRTEGSLWEPGAPLEDLSSDYKARRLNDTVEVLVGVQTVAAQAGSVNNQRQFATTSGISGLLGGIPTHGVNPLLNAQSNTTLKGQGQTASNTTLTTSMSGRVIDVLSNGNLVVEAEREIYMNNQHENVILRGVARPFDISAVNTIPSAALSNLEIEMKGKGIISDSVRPENAFTKAVLWLFGF